MNAHLLPPCSRRRLYALSLLVLLAGCGKTELYSKLNEQEGNEMLALLLQHNISSEKQVEKANSVSLHVNSDMIPAAMALLRKNGYPKEKFSTIKDLFNTDKLIASPYEDRTRYVYGLSQELADTLSRVDGVMTARVHIVMPAEDSQDIAAASAAVFIKHDPNYDLNGQIPQIKAIVASGIESLEYEAVNVALFPAADQGNLVCFDGEPLRSVLGLEMSAGSVRRFYMLFAVLGGALLLAMGGAAYLFRVRPAAAPNA